MSSLNTVSSDDVIESYRTQLSDAHHKVALLEAKVHRLMGEINKSASAAPAPTVHRDMTAHGQDIPSNARGVEIMPIQS